MQRNIVETILGAVVLLVAACFLFFFYRTTDIKPATGYEISADFDKIDGLQSGSPVRVSGVKVGKVMSFELNKDNYRAVVHMNIDNDVKLPSDSSAIIQSAGLLDGKTMTLQPGGADDMLKDGGKIQYTQSSASLEQMLGQFIFSVSKNNKKGDDDGDDAAAPAQDKTPAPAPEKTVAPAPGQIAAPANPTNTNPAAHP